MSSSGVRLDPTLVQAALEEAAPAVLEDAGALVADVDGKLKEEDVPDRLTEASLLAAIDAVIVDPDGPVPGTMLDVAADPDTVYAMRQRAQIAASSSSLILLDVLPDNDWYTGVVAGTWVGLSNSDFTFTAPDSGRVSIEISFGFQMPAGACSLHMRLMDEANNPVAGTQRKIKGHAASALVEDDRGLYDTTISGLIPGESYTYALSVTNKDNTTQVGPIQSSATGDPGSAKVRVTSLPAFETSDTATLVRDTALALPYWTAAKAAVLAGTRDAKILLVGDSTQFGDTANPVAKRLAAKLAGSPYSLAAVEGGTAMPLAAASVPYLTAGTGWPIAHAFGFGNQGWQVTSPAGNLVYANPNVNANRFDVYLIGQPGGGEATMQVNAETPVVEDLDTGYGQIVKVTVEVAAAAATTHTLTISATGLVTVLMIEPYHATTRKIRVANAAVHSSDAATWDNAGGVYSKNMIDEYEPDVVIVLLGVNDAVNEYSATTFMGHLQSILAAAPTADKIVVSPAPDSDPDIYALIQQYAPRERYQLNVPFIDMLQHFGTYAEAVTAGWITSPDPRHPNSAGQAQQVDLYAQMLASA